MKCLHETTKVPFWKSRYAIGLLVMGAVAGYFPWVEHQAHLLGALPYLLLLACPLMHVLMHRGGHGHHSHGSHRALPGSGTEDPSARASEEK